jgi:hypothetical protein
MARVFKALGIAAAGLFICLYLGLLSTHLGNPSEGLTHFLAFFVATPIVCLILFLVSFFLLGAPTRESHSDQALQHSGPIKPAIKSETGSTGFEWTRMVGSIVLSLVAGGGSFVLVRSFMRKNYNSGDWFSGSLIADMLAWIAAPAFAIAGCLLAFYLISLLKPQSGNNGD